MKGKTIMTITQKRTIGIDISKNHLDICMLEPNEKPIMMHIANNEADIKKLIKKIKSFSVDILTLEPTGNYERKLLNALCEAQIPVSMPNAAQIRFFAKESGMIAKTDQIDAKILALYGQKAEYRLYKGLSENERNLANLNKYRDSLSRQLVQICNQKDKTDHPSIIESLFRLEKNLKEEINHLEKQMIAIIQKDEELSKKMEILMSIPGVGIITSLCLLSHLTELGSLNKAQVASLCGLAPYTYDSGQYRGKSFIRGGRKFVRNKLYMAALVSIKYDNVFRDFYTNLRSKGKSFKQSLVGVMRKLVVIANHLIKNGLLFNDQRVSVVV